MNDLTKYNSFSYKNSFRYFEKYFQLSKYMIFKKMQTKRLNVCDNDIEFEILKLRVRTKQSKIHSFIHPFIQI
jgi:hypothetical protein